MASYTFTNIFHKEILIFQLDADNYEEAAIEWCGALLENTDKLKVSLKLLNKKVNTVTINKIMSNTWTFSLKIKKNEIIVYYTRTDENEENNYEIEDAAKYIYEKFPSESAKRIELEDVHLI